MPVDNQTILDLIDKINIKEAEAEKSISKYRQLRSNLQEIKMRNVKTPSANGGIDVALEEPMDSKLGIMMTAQRKQQIYDKIITDTTALGL